MAYSSPVLIVDDDPIFLDVTCHVLASLGVSSVSTASDGEEAIIELESAGKPFGLIILDLNMPNQDGLAFLRAAANCQYNGHIVVSSGEDGAIIEAAQNIARMLDLNVVGSIDKPINLVDMSRVLERCEKSAISRKSPRESIDVQKVTNDRIIPYYQPQYRAKDRSLRGAEALSRIIAEDKLAVAPGEFFEKISHTPQAYHVAISTVRKVFADLCAWQFSNLDCNVAINLDASILEQDIAPALDALSKEFGISPTNVIIELTETALPKDSSRLIETVARLRMMGYGIALDDFGTGMSNFDLLRRLPITELKIDLSIIQAMEHDSISVEFFKTAVKAANSLGLTVVAEGIETETQFRAVRDQGVDVVQGFLFDKALPPAQFEERLWETSIRAEAV